MVASSARVYLDRLDLLAHLATLGFQVKRERVSGVSLAHLDLRDLLALVMRGARVPQDLQVPQDPPHSLALIGRLSVFLALRVHLALQVLLEPWVLLLGR